MSKALDIANNLSEFDGLAPAIDLSDVTATNITGTNVTGTNVTGTNVTGTNVTPTNLNIASTHHTFTVKGIDETVGTDTQSGQLSIYNGATKLWGINEDGWVQNPNNPAFSAYGDSGGTSFGTTFVVPYNQIVDNIGGHYDTTTYAFTAPISGIYFFSASFLEYPSASSANITFWCSVNGSGYTSSFPMSRGSLTDQQTLGWHGDVSLSAGDYVQAKLAGTGDYYTLSGHAHFSGHLIG